MNTTFQMAMGQLQGTGNSQMGPGKTSDPMGFMVNFGAIGLILILFYVLLILPQRKQQKLHEQLLKTLKKGDEVVTSGGIFGSIIGFNEKDDTVFLKMSEGVKIEIQRNSISGLRKKKE